MNPATKQPQNERQATQDTPLEGPVREGWSPDIAHITERFFNQIVANQRHRLHSLLPEYSASRYNLRND